MSASISPHASSALRWASRLAREIGPWASILLLAAGVLLLGATALRDFARSLRAWSQENQTDSDETLSETPPLEIVK